jgi:glycosyltransferase involved in cell wall biosynthesis
LKLLFLSKRYPMGRDLILRPYGRFFYLPYYLAERGHEVTLLLLDYRNEAPADISHDGIRWISEPLASRNPGRYLGRLRQLLRTDRPDWVIGLSDTYFGILAQYYGYRYGIRSCIDAYDNYESYIPWLKPLHRFWRRALSRADLVTAAGPDLAQFMSQQRDGCPTVVVPMAADPIGFMPMDHTECRSQMRLPVDGRLIGYCGSLHKSRGVEVLFEAFERLRQTHPDVGLVLSGRQWGDVPVPESACSLGYIEDEKMPLLLNCMDALAVVNRDSAFGRYSHPVKLYEAMSCQVPVVVTSTAASKWILRNNPELLVPPSDAGALSSSLAAALDRGRTAYPDVPDWQSVCDVFERALQEPVHQA